MPNQTARLLGNSASLSSIGLATIDKDGVITSANASFCEMFAFNKPDETCGCSLTRQVESTFYSSIADLAQALNSPDASTLVLHRFRDAEPITLHIANTDTEMRLLVANQAAKHTSDTSPLFNSTFSDPLTGLGNRLLLNDILANWQVRTPEALSIAAIMIDLDRFKQVNDSLGHGAGDTLLKLVAKRIKSAARSADPVIRMGGDEFLVLHTIGVQPMGAESVAKRIVDLLSRPFLIDGQQVNIGASVGIAALNHGTENIADLLKHADLAMYEAKAAGRSTVKFFEVALAERALKRRNLEIDLRRALGLKQFMLMYQPQINMANGKLQGFEALIRWECPTRGFVSPADFIPLAEEIGEIHAIGEWVIRSACKEAMRWDGNFTVAVNVSPIQFENGRIVTIIQDALASTGLPPERLELEITEGILMKDYENAQKLLWEIKSMGVGIAMDDFGTGYSSLSHLSSFPFSKLKIDQSFVRGENSTKSRALVQAIISMGDCLGMKTIAEGVETTEQFNELAEKGCMEAQGYLISRPIKPEAITDFVTSHTNHTPSLGTVHESSPIPVNIRQQK